MSGGDEFRKDTKGFAREKERYRRELEEHGSIVPRECYHSPMPEEAPPKLQLDPESKESAERPPLYRVIERHVLEEYEDGSKKEEIIECDGRSHRHCIDVISYNEEGKVIGRGQLVEQVVKEELGPCDGKHS